MYGNIWVHYKQILCYTLWKTWASTDSGILGKSFGYSMAMIPLHMSQGGVATFSSLPSLQSASWSHIHSVNTHSPLFGHLISPSGHRRATGHPSSSEWSRQSRLPSQCREDDMHWPFSHWNSEELHSSRTEKGNALGKSLGNSEETQWQGKHFRDSLKFFCHLGNQPHQAGNHLKVRATLGRTYC